MHAARTATAIAAGVLTMTAIAAAPAALSTLRIDHTPPGHTGSCVTEAEFGQTDRGMKASAVHDLFDTDGAASGTPTERNYRMCVGTSAGDGRMVHVNYTDPGGSAEWRVFEAWTAVCGNNCPPA